MKNQVFSERFNRELTQLDLPDDPSERPKAVAKVFGVSRHLANAMILGQMSPSEVELNRIAAILEVCPQWLCGDADKKKGYSRRETAEITRSL